MGLSKKPFLVILSAVLAEALSGAKGKNLRNVDSTRVRRPFTQFTLSGKRRCFAALSMTASEGFTLSGKSGTVTYFQAESCQGRGPVTGGFAFLMPEDAGEIGGQYMIIDTAENHGQPRAASRRIPRRRFAGGSIGVAESAGSHPPDGSGVPVTDWRS